MKGMYEKYGVAHSQEQFDRYNKMDKVYRNNKMIYRLTDEDYRRIVKDVVPLDEYERIYIDLDRWYKERYYSMFIKDELVKYYKGCDRLSHEKDCEFVPIAIAMSNLFNVHHTDVSAIMGVKTADTFNYMSYEQLNIQNRVEEQLLKEGRARPYTSDADICNYARQLGISANKAFVKAYDIEPILIKRSDIDSDRAVTLYRFMTAKLKESGHLTDDKMKSLTENWKKSSRHNIFLSESDVFEELVLWKKRS